MDDKGSKTLLQMNGTNMTSLECEVMDEICAADSRGEYEAIFWAAEMDSTETARLMGIGYKAAALLKRSAQNYFLTRWGCL